MAEPEAFAIDTFAVFGGILLLRGWVCDPAGITTVHLRLGDRDVPLTSYGLIQSADVVAHLGPTAAGSRFDEVIAIDPALDDVMAARLVMTCRDMQLHEIAHLGFPRGQEAMALPGTFRSMLDQMPNGKMLEVGSCNSASIAKDALIPRGWSYVGLDIVPGPSVDLIGDAHELSSLFPARSFDAVMALSVIEHLAMPWKFVIELNRVLKLGAIGVITTHQAWPQQPAQTDCWRFSERSWDALLNRATGFEVVQAQMGEPTYFVAQRCHAITNFGMGNIGYLASNVLFRKIAETSLDWPVRVAEMGGAPSRTP